MKYKDWLHDWLDNYVKPSAKRKTCSRYVEIVEQHIIPQLGEYELDGLDVITIQKFITQLLQNGNLKTGGGLAPNSVNAIITVIQCSLETYIGSDCVRKYIADTLLLKKCLEIRKNWSGM